MMKADVPITRSEIVIVQWLPTEQEQLGEKLYNNILPKQDENEGIFVTFYKAFKRAEVFDYLTSLIEGYEDGTLITLHIVAHGNEDGIGCNDEFISWKELFYYTRQLNIKMCNTLLLILSSCVGGGIISCIEPEKRAPYMAIIANTRSITFDDVSRGFSLFYEDFRTPMDFPTCLKKLNASIDFGEKLKAGERKTEFFCMSAAYSFDEIFNPDRDPKNFSEIVENVKRQTFMRYGYIPKDLTEDKLKEMVKTDAERLRPYFTFQDMREL